MLSLHPKACFRGQPPAVWATFGLEMRVKFLALRGGGVKGKIPPFWGCVSLNP